MSRKFPTNDQKLRQLLKELDPLEMCVLRERLLTISEQTQAAIAEDSTKFDNPIFGHSFYLSTCKKIDSILGTD